MPHFHFPENQGAILLALARASISTKLGMDFERPEYPESFEAFGATFVTIKKGGALRGCIGSLLAHRPIHLDVVENALSAAFKDPRFSPLQRFELESTRMEVSLLSPIEEISFSSEIDALSKLRPMIDGVIFEYGPYRSTFLPQVWESLREPQNFLSCLKEKAGLPRSFWDESVKLSRYQVSKWEE